MSPLATSEYIHASSLVSTAFIHASLIFVEW